MSGKKMLGCLVAGKLVQRGAEMTNKDGSRKSQDLGGRGLILQEVPNSCMYSVFRTICLAKHLFEVALRLRLTVLREAVNSLV